MKRTMQKLTAGLAAILFAALSPLSMAAPPHTGIQGQTFLYISYGTPVEVEPGLWIGIGGVQLPVAASFAVFSARTGREVERVTTDANGGYAVSLRPGSYVLVPDPVRVDPGCFVFKEAIEVTVHPRKFTPLNVFYFHDGPPCVVQATP